MPAMAHTPTEILSDAEESVGKDGRQMQDAATAQEGKAAASGADGTVPGADMQSAGSCARELSCNERGGAAANADGTCNAANACNVSGAPASRGGADSAAQHPDLGAYSPAIWACLGDPAEALAEVGGG